MKFKTRLKVTFVTIIILPLALTALAFLGIVIYMTNVNHGNSVRDINYATMSEAMQGLIDTADLVYDYLSDQAEDDPTVFEDIEYLEMVNDDMADMSTYILVRKGDGIYFSGDPEGEDTLFDQLPRYGDGELSSDSGYYYRNQSKYVKQIDFIFSDGSEGSIFVITRVMALISRELLVDMFIAIVLILIFTSIMLTQWIRRSVFTPVDELNTAMQNIKEGNYDYTLETDIKGEIGELYRNYEDMRIRLKESLEENDQRENESRELISNISHDLKTPITSIKGYVEGIMEGVANTPEKQDKYLRIIYNKANDMEQLIGELTTYSNVENNRIPYDFHRINVAEYFGDCIEEVGMDLESKGIELNYSNLTEPDTMVIADPEQMKKVINNIISNSVKYMDKPHGIIDIRILDDVDSIRVEIADNGKGISQKELGRIFDRFYRTDSSRNSAQGGSGIGLSIVRKIIEDHGGYIWATSKEGEGTCMHFVMRKYKELKEE